MSTTYRGIPDASTPVPSSALSIASSTNATPIVVTTTAPHGLTDGDFVQIILHATNTAANGLWVIHYLSPTTFSLLVPKTHANSVGNGVGGATGAIGVFAWDTLITLSSDFVDDDNAAAIAVPAEALADRAAALGRLLAQTQLLPTAAANENNNTLFTSWDTISATTSWVASTIFFNPDLDVVDNDDVEFTFTGTLDVGAGANVAIGIFYHLHDYGVAPAFASATLVAGSAQEVSASTRSPVHLRGRATISAGHGKAVTMFIACIAASGTVTAKLYGAKTSRVQARRAVS